MNPPNQQLEPPFDPRDPEWGAIMKRVSQALVRYVPDDYKLIFCEVSATFTGEALQLDYRIRSPYHPDQEHTEPDEALHAAIVDLVSFWTERADSFPSVRLAVEIGEDKRVRNWLQILSTPQE
jgi:hypothetical protein